MRWSCPHCGINLAIGDDKLGPGWSFSRCYKCGGFALVRRAEVNLIKVDRAPAGENVLLPEATETPYEQLSDEATRNLASYRRAATPPPPPARMAPMPPAAAPPIGPTLSSDPLHQFMEAPAGYPPAPPRPFLQSVSEAGKRILPGAIAIAALTAGASGIYLYWEGQALWENARQETRRVRAERADAPKPETLTTQAAAALSSDQLRIDAMAPMRSPSSEGDATPATPPANLRVRAKEKQADLHSGPGSLFPILGYADPQHVLQVTDWSDRWFKVSLVDAKIPGVKTGTESGWIRTDLVQVQTQ